ncbi:MAG TPA: hypothetical protein PLI95_16115 [Polyangiaceae bacterium]|nr:hypothetical protein [Polyangiaceae bacterium]
MNYPPGAGGPPGYPPDWMGAPQQPQQQMPGQYGMPPAPYGGNPQNPYGGFGAPPPPPANKPNGLPQAALIVGIVAGCLCIVGLIPCLGWVNYFTLFAAAAGKVLAIVGLISEKDSRNHTNAIIGLVISLVALVVGSIRLALGAGCL